MLYNEAVTFLQLLSKRTPFLQKWWHGICFLGIIGGFAPIFANTTPALDSLAMHYLQKADFFYQEQVQYDSAFIYAQKAVPFFLQSCDWNNWYAAHWTIVLSLAKQQKHSEAFKWLREALQTATTTEMDKRTIGKIYNLFGYLYFNNGQFDKAYPAYALSLEWLEKSGNLRGVASIYNNLGWLSTIRGEHEQAFHYLQKAASLFLQDQRFYSAGDAHYNLGAAFMAVEKPDSALVHYQKALKLYEGIDASTFLRISEAHLFKQGTDQALQWASKALKLAQEEEYETTIAFAYLQMGDIFKQLHNLDLSLQYFEKAQRHCLKAYGWKHRETAKTFISIGDIYLQKKQPREAYQTYQEALQCLLPDSISAQNPGAITAYFQKLQLQPDRDIGIAFERMGDALAQPHDSQTKEEQLTPILSHYENALHIFSSIRMSYLNQSDKLFWGSSLHNIYEKAIHTAYQLSEFNPKYLNRVFGLIEKSKGAVLLASIQEMEARQFANIPDSLSEQIAQLKNNIAHLSYQKNSTATQNISTLEDALFVKKRELDTLLLSIARTYPHYKNWQQDLQLTSLSQLQTEVLTSNNLLLSYFIGEQKGYIAAIQQDKITISVIPNPSLVQENTAKLHQALSDKTALRNNPQKSFQQYTQSAYWLYEHLIVKALQNFEGNQLIIVPDGQLGYIPFETLLTSLPDSSKRRYKQLPYLLKDYNVSYAYSATLLEKSQKNYTPPIKAFSIAAFAPYAIGGEIASNRSLPDSILQNLSALPFSKSELEVLSQQFEGNFYLGAAAGEQVVKEACASAAILHFSTHTLIDDKDPMYSVLMFAKNDQSENEGYLYAYELYNRTISAEMAVLSACETGYGKWSRGEGILSLNRAFVHAGCPSTVMSLWQIDDKASAELVSHFYTFLQKGLPKDKALRQAKLHYLQESESVFAHPYYWAALVSAGNQKALGIYTNDLGFGKWMLIGGFVVIGFLGSWFFFFKKINPVHALQ